MSDLNKIWECTIFIAEDEIPSGADFPPREAAIRAIESMSLKVTACSSGWGCEEFTPKIAKLKTQNQQLKQRIERLECELRSLSSAVIQWDDCDTASQVRRAQGRMVKLAKQTDEQLRKGGE